MKKNLFYLLKKNVGFCTTSYHPLPKWVLQLGGLWKIRSRTIAVSKFWQNGAPLLAGHKHLMCYWWHSASARWPCGKDPDHVWFPIHQTNRSRMSGKWKWGFSLPFSVNSLSQRIKMSSSSVNKETLSPIWKNQLPNIHASAWLVEPLQ